MSERISYGEYLIIEEIVNALMEQGVWKDLPKDVKASYVRDLKPWGFYL